MQRSARIVLLGLIVVWMALLSACTESIAARQDAAKADQQARVPNEYLVTLAPQVDEAIIVEYYGRFGIKYIHALEEETYLLIVNNDPGPHKMEALIENESRIKVIQPNLIYWNYR